MSTAKIPLLDENGKFPAEFLPEGAGAGESKTYIDEQDELVLSEAKTHANEIRQDVESLTERVDVLSEAPPIETEEQLAHRQGFLMYFGDTEPEPFKYGVPVIWNKPRFKLIPVLPSAPTWNDFEGTMIVPSLVGAIYKITAVTKDNVTTAKDITITPNVVFDVLGATGLESPFGLKVEVFLSSNEYILSQEYVWNHLFPDPDNRTLVTSDTFSQANSEILTGTMTDAALGGTAKPWLIYTGHNLNGTQVTTFDIKDNSLHKRSHTEFYAAGATYTGDANTVRFDVGAVNQRIEFDLILPAPIPWRARIDFLVAAASGMHGAGHVFLITDAGVTFASPASASSLAMSTAVPVSGKYIFEVEGSTVRVKTPNEPWYSRSFVPPALTAANGYGTYFALRDTHSRKNTTIPAHDAFTYKIDNLVATKLGF